MRNLRPLSIPDKALVPVQESDSKFLFVIGGDDSNLHGELFADMVAKRMELAGKSQNCEVNRNYFFII